MANPAAMAAYLFWIIESGRGSQLEGHVVKLGSYLKDTGRDDAKKGRFLMKDPVVAKALKRVKELNPGESLPMTSGTRSLAAEVIKAIPEVASTKFIGAREQAMFSLECVGGARIGEIAGAQVGHGVFAVHMSVLQWRGEFVGEDGETRTWPLPAGVGAGERFVEHDNETSKTGVSRVMSFRSSSRFFQTKISIQLEELEGKFADFEEFISQIIEKREEVYNAFEARKNAITEKRNKRSLALENAADRILKGVDKRALDRKSTRLNSSH